MTSAITDFTQYTALRKAAGNNDPAALKEVANRFEALFLQNMLKSMRDASPGDPLFGDSNQHEMYQEMLDQQLAADMAGRGGIGLAEMLVRQLGGEDTRVDAGTRRSYRIAPGAPAKAAKTAPLWTDPQSFAREIWPHAQHTGKVLGVAPEAIVAQAALETGWGRRIMGDASGATSFNLFGVKGGGGWGGEQVVHQTIEFSRGVPTRQAEKFRAYTNVSAAFADYTDLIASSPRYENVRGQGNNVAGFARALQDSGYATDPAYAEKIQDVLDSPTMRRVIAELKTGS